MMTRLSLLTLAFAGVAGLAQAQTYAPAPAPVYVQRSMSAGDQGYYRSQAMTMDSGMRFQAAITDEYGMRYNSRGDRLDAQGRIMPPPVTPPGVAAYR